MLEPRGHDAIVGALLTPPVTRGAVAGVMFFDNVGPLWMCGHGTIGVVRTLEYLGRIAPGPCASTRRSGPSARSSPSTARSRSRTFRRAVCAKDVAVEVPGVGRVVGDVAYGGNWFFLARNGVERVELAQPRAAPERDAFDPAGARRAGHHGRGRRRSWTMSFCMGPRGAPTPTAATTCSAPAAPTTARPAAPAPRRRWPSLHARGELAAGQRYRQESITGSLFTGWLEERDGQLMPRIQGRAYVTGRATLYFDPRDPFRTGLSGSLAEDMPAPDVLVVGAGIVGAACAEALTAAGLSVEFLESRFAGAARPRRRWATSSSWTTPRRSSR